MAEPLNAGTPHNENEQEERVLFHPSPLQRVLALLGVAALIFLFIALLYLIRKMT